MWVAARLVGDADFDVLGLRFQRVFIDIDGKEGFSLLLIIDYGQQ